ncbi:MAG: hypothetical protein ACD_23C00526G0002 [uncultured bacterium]|nr:MAG: hypothetical protein ACD_23C00526G0002 [uncultured bacterium]
MFHLPSFPSRVALALCLMTALSAQAQYTSDIDIYSGDSATDRPNVLILLDNTANWENAFTNEMAALKSTIEGLTADKFNVGLMMFTETGAPNTGDDGGYVRAAIRTMDSIYKAKFQAMLNGFDVGGDKSNGGKAGKTMAEAYYYFTGSAPNSGNNKVKTDYTGNTSGTPSSNAIYNLSGNALTSFSATRYVQPGSGVCARNYIIYISNGVPKDAADDNRDASTRLTAAYTAAMMTRPADITGLSNDASQVNIADEWARFMRNSPSNITTYTLDVDKKSERQGLGWSALLRSMAQQSGGEYFSVSSSGSELADKLSSIFNQIQSVDSVFSSASLPVSTSARGSFDNQVFMGMFRPDRDSHPRWRGNLKQYQFKYDPITDTLALVGADGEAAIGDKGFISTSAVSFWTSTSTFWSNQQLGTPPSSSDRPDGEVVEKGGVAQLIRSANTTNQTQRKLYTCVGCANNTVLSSTATAEFTTANSSSFTALSSNSSERDQIINWVRGTDNAGDESGPGGTTTIRPSVHGDVLHSRPAVVNYGGDTGVVVFYGSNDGMLRAINGKQTGTGAGQELWGFIPEEHFPKLKRLRDNTPKIRISTTNMPASDLPTLRDYFVDGPIGVYQGKDARGNNIKYLYVAMRRGGRFIYALDVTNPTAPKFLWKKSYTDTNFEKLGQTWSEPMVVKIKGNTNPVIIMGAGYDADAEDLPVAATTTMGNAVLILDAFTGAHIKTLNTTRSVAADVNVVDSDSDGYVDRAYAVDTGGNIYRIDLETPSSSDTSVWKIYTLAELSDASTTRKFFYRPDVLRTAKFTAIMVGSGDREKPLYTSSNDAFFTVFDERVSKGAPAEAPTTIKESELRKVGSTEEPNPSLAKGCFIPLATGEKVVNASTTFLGMTYFGTNQPNRSSSQACTANLGIAKTYGAPVFCRAPESQEFEGGGLPPSPVAGFVTVTYTPPGSDTPISSQKPFVIGKPNPKKSPLQASLPPGKLTIPQRRQYWYQQNAR